MDPGVRGGERLRSRRDEGRLGPLELPRLSSSRGTCSSEEESACHRLSDRLDSIEAQAVRLTEQSWESLVRVQELQSQRTDVRRQMAEEGCTVDT
jgi:hypothetical protein